MCNTVANKLTMAPVRGQIQTKKKITLREVAVTPEFKVLKS